MEDTFEIDDADVEDVGEADLRDFIQDIAYQRALDRLFQWDFEIVK